MTIPTRVPEPSGLRWHLCELAVAARPRLCRKTSVLAIIEERAVAQAARRGFAGTWAPPGLTLTPQGLEPSLGREQEDGGSICIAMAVQAVGRRHSCLFFCSSAHREPAQRAGAWARPRDGAWAAPVPRARICQHLLCL